MDVPRYRLPLVFGLLRWIDLGLYKALRLWGFVRDELAWALTSHKTRTEITCAIYSNYCTFIPGGELFEGGLFDWEATLLASGTLPESGRILLGAAGGGREVKALCRMGYSVLAFEPADLFAPAAERLVRELPNAEFRRATYEEFAEGPTIRNWAAGRQIDIVWLGYGSFTHVTDPVVRTGIIRAAREIAPDAPVILSAFGQEHADAGLIDRARAWVRRRLRTLGIRNIAGPGDGFSFHGGFYHQFSRRELEELAASGGYAMVLHRTIPQGQFCAVFKPLAA